MIVLFILKGQSELRVFHGCRMILPYKAIPYISSHLSVMEDTMRI